MLMNGVRGSVDVGGVLGETISVKPVHDCFLIFDLGYYFALPSVSLSGVAFP